MKLSLTFFVRVIGMVLLGYLGFRLGVTLSGAPLSADEWRATALLMLAGAGLGLLTTPRWTIEPLREYERYVRSISIVELTAIVFGMLIGLLFAALLTVPLAQLPAPFGQIMPVLVAGALIYLSSSIFSARKTEVGDLLRTSRTRPSTLAPMPSEGAPQPRRILLDTSVIIDGRIPLMVQTGFLEATLLVPNFVLSELQLLADSSDELKRGRGKRGLDLLATLRKQEGIAVEVINVDVPNTNLVDEKLVVLARQYRCPILTNDANLGRVAELQSVRVLNINQLADAIRPPVVPGQDLSVKIRDVGRERDQGISFLDDGTMVVVEDARALVGVDVTVVVTRVYQTQTGRIVFAQLQSRAALQETER